jgi:short-subunit dehydrogenase
MRSQQRVLITGAGTGLGRRLAIELDGRGHRVTAGVLTGVEADDLAAARPSLSVIHLDITNRDDRARARDLELDVLVNNAGLGQAGPLRAIPLERLRRVFDVNVFGTMAMTQTVLPGMIERGRGRILIMSSVAGVLAGPMTGPYSMTKHALQAMGSALRTEVAPLGVDVALVNPGPFATGFNDAMVTDSIAWFDPQDALPGELDFIEQARTRITGAQLDPAQAVATIADLVEADQTELVNFIPPDIVERIRRSE